MLLRQSNTAIMAPVELPDSYVITNVRFGSAAVIGTNSSSMAALGRKADIRPGRMSALTDTGHSEELKRADLNDHLRPEAAECN